MKVRKIVLKQGSVEKYFKEVEESLDKPLDNSNVLYFEDISHIKKILTEERLKILYTIKHKKIESVYSLAKMLKRDRKAVTIDLEMLENLGFIDLNKEEGTRLVTRPSLNYDRLDISIEF